MTQFGWVLKFHAISCLPAPTRQAKGKIEREPQLWQGPLPVGFASETITAIVTANPPIAKLRARRNAQEVYRERHQRPQGSWHGAKRKMLRPADGLPWCPWWD